MSTPSSSIICSKRHLNEEEKEQEEKQLIKELGEFLSEQLGTNMLPEAEMDFNAQPGPEFLGDAPMNNADNDSIEPLLSAISYKFSQLKEKLQLSQQREEWATAAYDALMKDISGDLNAHNAGKKAN